MTDSMKIPQPPKPAPQLRYAVLQHDGVLPPHFDLMFETDPRSLLSTWRSQTWPILSSTPLLKVADHRREFLTFEGPLTGNRGSVTRVISGYYRLERPTPGLWQMTFRDYLGFVKLEFRKEDVPPKATPSGAMQSPEEPWTARPT